MKGELNKDYYCSADGYVPGNYGHDYNSDDYSLGAHGYSYCPYKECPKACHNYHRKWPTPTQFKEEYGKDYPDDGIGYWTYLGSEVWKATSFADFKNYISSSINTAIRNPIFVCACTPWGKPPNDWRPE